VEQALVEEVGGAGGAESNTTWAHDHITHENFDNPEAAQEDVWSESDMFDGADSSSSGDDGGGDGCGSGCGS
jgi:hypothetical protein